MKWCVLGIEGMPRPAPGYLFPTGFGMLTLAGGLEETKRKRKPVLAGRPLAAFGQMCEASAKRFNQDPACKAMQLRTPEHKVTGIIRIKHKH